jgi:hypothetical protein
MKLSDHTHPTAATATAASSSDAADHSTRRRRASLVSSLSGAAGAASLSRPQMTRQRLVALLDEAILIASGVKDWDNDDDNVSAIRPSCARQSGQRCHESYE